MKIITNILFFLIAIESNRLYAYEIYTNNVIHVSPQPIPILQVMVHQAPAYTVMVPVIVQPSPVIEQRVIWGYPYQAITVPASQYRYWGYDRRCLPIVRY